MKLGILAATTLVGAVSLVSAAQAQENVSGFASAIGSEYTASAAMSSISVANAVPSPQDATTPAGVAPQSFGPYRSFQGAPSSAPAAAMVDDSANLLMRRY